MKTRKEEIEEMMDAIDDQIRARYPEIEHAWLHNAIGKKMKLEMEWCRYV